MNFAQYTKEFSYNIKLAYPVILGLLGYTLIGIVDTIKVGNLAQTCLAARRVVAVSFSDFFSQKIKQTAGNCF